MTYLHLKAILVLAAMTLFGLIAGFFYAYSVDVMRGLDRIAPGEAINAMQAINAAVRNPVFFVTFFLTPLVALAAAGLLVVSGEKIAATLMAAAAVLYLAGVFIPTVVVNVPMNEALATVKIATASQDLEQVWQAYSSRWTFWNTFRTIISTGSLILSGTAILAMKS